MGLPVPAAALAQHVIALGKTGAGKSSALRALVEWLLEQQKPVCIIDPKGDWWGIKSSGSGKSAGYPVIIFGGEHADVPINEHSGSAVAELVAGGNRPCLIDLGGWMVGERTRFFIAFAAAFFKHARGLRHLVIDEVHNFAPQGKVLDVDAGKMLHWANRLASEGRGKGITLLAASQRPQKVHKDFVTSCETLIAMRVTHPLDRGAIKDWMDGCADPAKSGDIIRELAIMKRGQAFVWSPEIDFGPERVAFPMFRTFDSFKPRTEAIALKGWATVDLEDVKTKLAGFVAEAEANDPKKLRARIRELEVLLRKSSSDEAEKSNTAELLRSLREEVKSWRKSFAAAAAERDSARDRLSRIAELADAEISASASPVETPRRQQRPTTVTPGPRPSAPVKTGVPAAELGKGERAILTAIAQSGDVDAEQLTVLTGYKRSSRDTYCQRLRSAGYITTGWPTRVTDTGLGALGDFDPLPIGDELCRYWLERLGGGEQKILRALVDAHPDGLTREEIDDRTAFKRSSRDTYLQRLGARKLVDRRDGLVFASGMLFG